MSAPIDSSPRRKEGLRRFAPGAALLLVAVVAGLSLAASAIITRHFREQALTASRIYATTFAGLADPSPSAATEALFELGSRISEMGIPLVVTDSAFYRMQAALDTAALRAEAESRSPRIRSAVAGASAARANVRASRSAYWPSLTLSANTAWNASRTNDYDLLNQRQLSLALRWSLFDRFDRELSIAEREASLDVAQAEAAESRREVAALLTARLADLAASRAEIEISNTSVVAAREDLRVQQERYRLGASTIVDVLTSQEALNQAEVDVVVARFNYLRARAQLEALIGRSL